jgi:prevent-host-death family protein
MQIAYRLTIFYVVDTIVLIKRLIEGTYMQVSIRELKAHLSRYLAQAQKGQLLDITSHRKVVARIVGVPSTESVGVTRLLAGGSAHWLGGKPVGAAIHLSPVGRSISEMILEDRE